MSRHLHDLLIPPRLPAELAVDVEEPPAGLAPPPLLYEVLPALRGRRQVWLDGEGAEKGEAGMIGQGGSAPAGEDVGALRAVRADVAAHVLHDAEDGQPHLPAEGDLPPHVPHRHGLGCGHQDGPFHLV